MKKLVFMGMVALSAFAACKSDKPDLNKEATLGDIMNSTKVSNSDLIRNPVTADAPVNPDEVPQISFTETAYDFGTINQGDTIVHVFKFKNTGNAPLVVSNARAGCGCTIPSWPKQPIAPGAEGSIRVKFNSRGKEGHIDKPVTITANTYPSTTSEVKITGEVNIPK